MKKEEIAATFRSIQQEICRQIENADGKAEFTEDQWEREEGGGGFSRLMNQGDVIEKGGVNFSAVHGKTPDKILKALQLDPSDFYATGVSIVMHPFNPFVPIIHMNIRYFEMSNGEYWFGGGIDLTPHYIFKEDAKWFHQQIKNTCDKFDPQYYPTFKKWADEYFFIPHRNETRGIGGIFFDRLKEDSSHSKKDIFDFVTSIGKQFAPIYIELFNRRRDTAFSEREKNWQYLRRGRYVEFNLVYDRGTKFGLDTNGRTESILMSMPPHAEWVYNHIPQKGSNEYQTSELLKKEINWIE